MSSDKKEEIVHIYVDGSYIRGKVGYGVVILNTAGEPLEKMCGGVPPERAENTRQVAGELIATGKALVWCREKSIYHAVIYYDYKGIECWATGTWKTNLPLTQNYARFIKQLISEGFKIDFRKVKAHTGNKWNDAADLLAKAGALGKDPNNLTDEDLNEPAQNQSSENHASTETANPAVETARKTALKFNSFLLTRNIDSQYDDVYNGMYARLKIRLRAGFAFFDLYNTKNKPLQPYLHNFKDDKETEERLKRLWGEFRSR